MSEALSKLIEAVATGQAPTGLDVHRADTGHSDHITMVLGAFNGSLDAAKALHEALLPGWTTVLGQNAHHGDWSAIVRLTEDGEIAHEYYGGADDLPARAWLLAILRAYAAQQEPTP